MEPSARQRISPVQFTTADGVVLHGDVSMPGPEPRAVAVVCHPHPQYGGNRYNLVVHALFDALPAVGVATLRFDFRPTFGGGVDEVLDAAAALARARDLVADRPSVVIGYSFGAMVALALADPRLAAKVLVAPPFAMSSGTAAPDVPTLVLTPAHDQFSPPSASAATIAGWGAEAATLVTSDTVELADHFLQGRTAAVTTRTIDWLDTILP